MAIQILERNDPRFPQGGPDPESDQLARQKAMIRARQDERDVFKSETVQITFGPKKEKQDVVLKWPSSARIVETHDDHRIQMAGAILGCAAGPVRIDSTDGIDVSFPTFLATLESVSR